ncbi:MAG: hypothetical protein HYZ32_00225, partial [Hydrocarboniphaga effusa]|nr:hypothetical protein [Hydrocarboniphaga effusa]
MRTRGGQTRHGVANTAPDKVWGGASAGAGAAAGLQEVTVNTGALIAGLDEVGRGCIAGPVYAAAVILPPGQHIRGLDDSKKLSVAQREALAPVIKAC